MTCVCEDGRHDFWSAAWHRAYCAWFDHDRAGHRARAGFYGALADLLVRLVDRWA